jgi:8-oxo-dGTP pyrophosphatase MutT (NUDIX family)
MPKQALRVIQGGAIVVKPRARAPRILIVRSSDGQSWLFPKGHTEDGETPGEAAAREAREEAGVVGRVCAFVGRDRYARGKRLVVVSYYRLDYLGDAPADEDRARRWCTPAEARRLLSFPELVDLLDRALTLSEQTDRGGPRLYQRRDRVPTGASRTRA